MRAEMYPESPVTSDGYNLQMKTGVVTRLCEKSFKPQNRNSFSRLVNQKVDRLSSNRHIGAGAEGDE
jgi:hypothetical protein